MDLMNVCSGEIKFYGTENKRLAKTVSGCTIVIHRLVAAHQPVWWVVLGPLTPRTTVAEAVVARVAIRKDALRLTRTKRTTNPAGLVFTLLPGAGSVPGAVLPPYEKVLYEGDVEGVLVPAFLAALMGAESQPPSLPPPLPPAAPALKPVAALVVPPGQQVGGLAGPAGPPPV
eukprot:contig_27059_g6660